MDEMNRRRFLEALGLAGLALAGTCTASGQVPRKPNIVFILADDLGRHQVATYGNTFYETPNVDRIAAQGMRFTDAYAAAPICSATRASIMTGKYPARLHITDYIPGNPFPYARLKTPDWSKALPLEETTLPEMLAAAGYVSGHFGKWHLSADKEYRPGRPGDPDTQGFSDVLACDKPESDAAAKAGADPNYDAHHAREITDRAIAFMEAHQDAPFFCYIAHSLIHRPEMEYAPRIIKYATKPEACNESGNNPVLGAMVETLDGQVGRIMDALDDLGLAGNTILIFFSDNGDFYGREGLKPFYGAKADLYEGGVRVPLVVRWPGVVAPGSDCTVPMCSIDFFPTFAEIAGVKVDDPEVDGVSLLDTLRGAGAPERDALFWHYPHYHSIGIAPSGSVRQGRYKLIEWFEKSIEGPETPGAFELFDLESDPGERHNLAAEMPEKTAELEARLRAWRDAVGAQMMPPNPAYDPARAGKAQ